MAVFAVGAGATGNPRAKGVGGAGAACRSRGAGGAAVSEQGATTLASICSRAARSAANAGPSDPAFLGPPESPPHRPPGLYFPIWHAGILYLCPGRMAAASRNYLAVGLLLFSFLLVASLAYQRIQTATFVDLEAEEEGFRGSRPAEGFRGNRVTQSSPAEGFESSGGPRAVTRAEDCSCIPGYIPSKRDTSYVCQKLGDPSKTRQCY